MIKSRTGGLHEYLNELSDDMLEYNFHVWTGNHMLDMILNQKEKDAQNQNTVMQIDTEVFSTLPLQTGKSYPFSGIYWIMRWKPVRKSMIKSVG